MKGENTYEVIIIGGSNAGLSAAMSLGRSLRKVLVIDSGKPCNAPTPYSHNFLTRDGATPEEISTIAKEQVLSYPSVHFQEGLAQSAEKKEDGSFDVTLDNGQMISAQKLVIATGMKDILPQIPGFQECWGKSVIHCPYCHGYEVHHTKTGVLANGERSYEFASMIQHWTDDLTLFTNGVADLTNEERSNLSQLNVAIDERPIQILHHVNGQIEKIEFEDQSTFALHALYAAVPTEQHSTMASELGCLITEAGYIEVDPFQKTTVEGVYAVGDCTSPFRKVSIAVASGSICGAALNREMIQEDIERKIS
ncbi:NAD(P)/FAD-dependent oxidoreductase [Phaeocystidibacter marisrubri]|uniref:NAD(P)/FAD-dependent oxidoreductase n=1 Tax=Phaeocystidibacter marisrubri TaxID=1577780 RepID=A0A6L3ZIK6_9FLAO|nr:NAD(P)/FAD-dependent oxidoreductase [Phaeocystidibacter marisrubri]KAB2817010.1 NAD(P)/FAD-dependent oxidoreductase [Phaeocystidibacter marisrubri]GGH77219.1 thioredoxin reductase [Phaeocystidibacter marisrubri]